jgi:hypothetical protein
MKPPTGKQIGVEILKDHRSVHLPEGPHTLKSLSAYLVPLHTVIPKSVIKDGVPAQLSWIYEAFRKGATDDPRASLPHEEIIEEMILLLSLNRFRINDSHQNAQYLDFWAKRKKSRANAKGGKARAKNEAKNIVNNFLPLEFSGWTLKSFR